MSDTFKYSIAQVNVQFPIETVIEPMAGENYSRALIYMPISKATTYLPGVTSPAAGNMIVLDSSSYGSTTGDLLNSWLVPFFTAAQAAKVGVALYDDTDGATSNLLSSVYEATKFYAYFKFGITDSSGYIQLQKDLGNLCKADTLYSRLWIGTSDSNVLTATSALVTELNQAGIVYRLIYNPNTTINAALAQLGKSLESANTTGTPVGNSVDMVAFNTIQASGANDEDGTPMNLSATEKKALDDQKIGYNTYVGDGTTNVVTEGSVYSNGDSVGAEWVKSYITYMSKINTANLMTQPNKFRNNATYQEILATLCALVQSFVNMGRLANFVLSAPSFADLPTSGDTITVANAWSARYVDNLREVTVYGTLYITQPTR